MYNTFHTRTNFIEIVCVTPLRHSHLPPPARSHPQSCQARPRAQARLPLAPGAQPRIPAPRPLLHPLARQAQVQGLAAQPLRPACPPSQPSPPAPPQPLPTAAARPRALVRPRLASLRRRRARVRHQGRGHARQAPARARLLARGRALARRPARRCRLSCTAGRCPAWRPCTACAAATGQQCAGLPHKGARWKRQRTEDQTGGQGLVAHPTRVRMHVTWTSHAPNKDCISTWRAWPWARRRRLRRWAPSQVLQPLCCAGSPCWRPSSRTPCCKARHSESALDSSVEGHALSTGQVVQRNSMPAGEPHMWAAVSVRASFPDTIAAAPPHSFCTNSSQARPASKKRSSAPGT